MRSPSLAFLVALGIAGLSGCLFFDSNPDPCESGGIRPAGDPATFRNPDNGMCVSYGGGSGCDDGRIYETAAFPNWATCGACEGFDENTCAATEYCRTVAIDVPATTTEGAPFVGPRIECWGVALPSDPSRACIELDAYGCSQRNDCQAQYTDNLDGTLTFVECRDEAVTGCYSNQDCGPGELCTAETECLPPPGCDGNGSGDIACPAVCYGRCVPADACALTLCAEGYECVPRCDGMGTCFAECVPTGNTCAATTCPVGFDCVEVCDAQAGCRAECVPQTNACDTSGIQCPDGTHCEACGPNEDCLVKCVQDPVNVCESLMCPVGTVCVETCVIDQLGQGTCSAGCAPDVCAEVVCDPGTHCEACDPNDPSSTDPCVTQCVPDNVVCSNILCGPGTHCGNIGCGDMCISDAGLCWGDVNDLQTPPSCPAESVPGILDGRYTGFCIPLTDCALEPCGA